MSNGIQNGSQIGESNFRGMIFAYAGLTAPSGFLLCDGSAVSRTTYADLYALISDTYGAGDGSTTFNVPDLRSSLPVGKGQRVLTFDFLDADVNTSTDVITVDSNDWLHTGQAVVLSNSGGTLPAGLSAGTYYVIRDSATTIKLATSIANANRGVQVDITGATGGGTHTLTLTLTDRSLGDNGGEETHALTDSEMPSHAHDIQRPNISGSTSNQIEGTTPNGVPDGGWITDPYINKQDTANDNEPRMMNTGSDSPHNNMPPYTTVNYIIKT